MIEGAPELEALLLDAGNTVVFLDMDAVAAVARAEGVEVEAAQLLAVEGAAKRHYEAILAAGAPHETGWRLYLTTLLCEAGVPRDAAASLVDPLRAAHDELNLWRRVPPELPAALDDARALGLRVAIVSNSEGRLPELFAHVGLGDAFELVVDSAHEGCASRTRRSSVARSSACAWRRLARSTRATSRASTSTGRTRPA
ncbi:MAG: hypothetical protein M5U28_00275 [Sandaracinaceae bacterium]|nr:hypothetical protein [Sandaracinaceae bacterium]